MLIGKAGRAATAISTADAASLTVRGRDLCGDLMGRLSFTEYFHLLVTGREPTETQRFFLDLLLVAIAEHGLVPTNQAARMTYAADPAALQARGRRRHPRLRLGRARHRRGSAAPSSQARGHGSRPARSCAASSPGSAPPAARLPGFGHPLHKPVDPRAQRILALAEEKGAAGPQRGARPRRWRPWRPRSGASRCR